MQKDKAKDDFSEVLDKRKSRKKKTTDRCNTCINEEEAEDLRIAANNVACVQRVSGKDVPRA